MNNQKLRAAHKAADASVRALLEEACGKDIFSSRVTDRVKSVRDACEELGRDYDVEFSPDRLKLETEDETGYREIKIFYEALNEGVAIDFYNPKQKKYYAWIEYVSGRGLSLFDVGCDHATTSVGPRLCCVDADLVRYAFNQIPDSFNKFYSNHKK